MVIHVVLSPECAVTNTAPGPSVRCGAGKAGSQPGAQARSPSAVKSASVAARGRLTVSSALQAIVSGIGRSVVDASPQVERNEFLGRAI